MIDRRNLRHLISRPRNPLLGVALFGQGKKRTSEKHIKHGIKVIEHGPTKLTIITNPTDEEVSYLKKNYSFHPLHIEDILSTIQRPKIDEEEHYIFMVVHIPEIHIRSGKIISKEVDFFLTDKEVIMVVDTQMPEVDDLLDKIEKSRRIRKEYFLTGPGYLLYKLVDTLIDSIFPLLERFENGIEVIDRNVFTKESQNVSEQISFLRRNIIFAKTLIKPELNSFQRIEESTHKLMVKNLLTYFGNITDHLKKIWDRLEDIQELTDNLSVTFEGYITFRTNETIKLLTIISVIMLPLNLLAGIYGMNLSFLPLAHHPFALAFISVVMSTIVITMILYFRFKRWI